MMTDPREAYLEFLGPQVGIKANNHWDIISLMFKTEFVWTVPNDDNRLGDGMDLRNEWGRGRNLGPCSFLEVLIGLARRMAFITGENAEDCAWHLMENLGLNRMTDPLSRRQINKARDILDIVIWRTYHPDGSGGFFPLREPHDDQRKVELWYQMSAYIEEAYPE